MNVKMKTLAVAVALAATSGAANALDMPNSLPLGGELFLSVWDPTVGNEASFNIGLNLNALTFDGSASYTFSDIFSNPTFLANFDSANIDSMSNWQWNVVGAATLSNDYGTDSETFLFTSQTNDEAINITAAQQGANSVLMYQQTLQTFYGTSDVYGTNGDPALASYAGHGLFGSSVNGQPIATAGFVGDELYFYSAYNQTMQIAFDSGFEEFPLPSDPAVMALFEGVWSLDANGTLTYSALGAPVPVPAAVWLLGSALIGLVGVARRRETQAEALTA